MPTAALAERHDVLLSAYAGRNIVYINADGIYRITFMAGEIRKIQDE
jgi:hypothetical protein